MSHRSLMLRRAIATTLAISGVIGAPTTWAQESSETLGAIIVTAQKREQNLQDVPIVVTAVSEQLLHDTGVKDIKDLTVLTPGLLVTSSSSEASTTARIRGIGTVGDNPGLESSVGVVIDGVYRPRNGVSFGDLGEMERIEVLKGPQGTLFGKNITAGVINVVSKKPTFEPSSVVEITAGNRGTMDVSTSLNGPIAGDMVAGRLFAAIRQRDGLISVKTAGGFPATNPGARPDKDADRDFYTLRGQLLFKFSDDVDLRVIGDLTERDEQCCTAVQMSYYNDPLLGQIRRAIVDSNAPDEGVIPVPDPDKRLAYANRGFGNKTRDQGVSFDLNWDLGDYDLTSVTAWRNWRSERGQDSDYTTADIWYRLDNGEVFSQFQQLTEEIRLAGQTGRVNWLGGVFYAKEKLNTGDRLLYGRSTRIANSTNVGPAGTTQSGYEEHVSRSLSANTAPTLLSTWTGMLPGTLYPAGTGLQDAYQQTSESFALFTNDSIELTDALELTVGARFTNETKDLQSYHWNPDGVGSEACSRVRQNIASQIPGSGVVGLPPGALASVSLAGTGAQATYALRLACGAWADPTFNSLNLQQSLDESEFTGTVKAAYRFTDEVMAYVSYARGYKASGFNLDRERIPDPVRTTTLPNSDKPGQTDPIYTVYDPDKSFPKESVDSLELGAKTSLMGNALFLNAAVFYQTYDNFQLNTFLGTSFVVTAVKEVVSQGIDLDAIYQTDSGLGFQGGITYTKTEIEDYGASAGIVRPERLNDRLGFAPLWSASAAVTYRRVSGDYAMNSNFSAKYNSSYNTGSNLDPRKLQEANTVMNARFGFGAEDSTWTLELWGQNITDENYAQVMFDAPLQGSSTTPNETQSTIDAFLGQRRLYGASLILKF